MKVEIREISDLLNNKKKKYSMLLNIAFNNKKNRFQKKIFYLLIVTL